MFKYKCTHCEKEYKFNSERKRHELSHFSHFSCKYCDKSFNFINAKRRHEKQHNRTGKVKCGICDHKFLDEHLLNRHMKYTHKGTFTCEKCSATFSSETALKNHSNSHKPETARKYKCRHRGCKKTFNYKHHLIHHEMTHTNTKQYQCPVCGKGFIQLHHLKSHAKIHDPDNWLACGVKTCKKMFPTEYARKRHLATHKPVSKKESTSSTEMPRFKDKTEKVRDDQAVSNKKSYTEEKLIKDEVTVSNCVNTLGQCLISNSNEVNDDCLCVQMTYFETEPDSTTLIQDVKENNRSLSTTASSRSDEDVSNNTDKFRKTTCESNNKALNKKIKMHKLPCCTKESATLPLLEYRTDGTVKLKETFDADIAKIEKDQSDKDVTIPDNNCKDVLGQCIASEDGKMGAGCLCAKMSASQEQMSVQEMYEMTPLNLISQLPF